jgi:hypothetical protein
VMVMGLLAVGLTVIETRFFYVILNNNFDIRSEARPEYVEIEVDKEKVDSNNSNFCKNFRLKYECWYFGKPTREAWNENGYSIESLPRKVELKLAPQKKLIEPQTIKEEAAELKKIKSEWVDAWDKVIEILKPFITKLFDATKSVFGSNFDDGKSEAASKLEMEQKKEFIKCIEALIAILNDDICSDDETTCLNDNFRDLLKDDKIPSEIFLKQLERLNNYFKKYTLVEELIKKRDNYTQVLWSEENRDGRLSVLKTNFKAYDGAEFKPESPSQQG